MALDFVLRRTRPAVPATVLAIFCAMGIQVHGQAASSPATTPGTATQPAPHSSGSAANPTHAAKHRAQGHVTKEEPQPVVVVPRPPDPPPPDWPVNDKAIPASVAWNGRNLSIAATNASLDQILHDVSTATGVKVEGLGSDERIYGSYGPATARDVLSQLLDGSGYNVLMIGDQGEGTPRELVLTAKASHDAAQGQTGNTSRPNQTPEDEAPEDPEPPEQPDQNMRRPFTPPQQPGQNRTPQQILQEMQQRQQQQQQQQPQQGVPVPQPNN